MELLTRTPSPRPLRSSSWGYGFFRDPSPGSSGECAMPTPPRITNPEAEDSHRVRALPDPASAPCPQPLAVTKPQAEYFHEVRALADPATAPCPQPLASPSLEIQIPVGSKLWQISASAPSPQPWRFQASGCRFPCCPSDDRSSVCAMPRTPGVPDLVMQIPSKSRPRQIQRPRQVAGPWHPPTS